MTFQEANNLLDEATAFLISCGGVYSQVNVGLQTRLLDCIACDRYIVARNNQNEIIHALFYWLVDKQDVEPCVEGCQPHDLNGGDTLFIIEHGNKAGRRSLTEFIKELRRRAGSTVTGVFWCHKGNGFKQHLQQKGV